MNNGPLTPHQFILEAVDRERLCPVLQSIFKVTDLNALQAILGDEAADDRARSRPTGLRPMS